MKDNFINWITLSISTFFTVVQTNQIFQLISVILTCLSAVVALSYNIYKWCIKAKKDNKISINEVKDLKDIIDEAIDNFKNIEK